MAAKKKPAARAKATGGRASKRPARKATPAGGPPRAPVAASDPRIGAVRDVFLALTARPSPHDPLEVVCAAIEKCLGLGSIDVYEYDPVRDELRVTWSYMSFDPKQAAEFVGTAYSLATHPLFRRALTEGAVVEYRAEDTEFEEDDPLLHAEMTAWGEKAVIETGLFFSGEPLGVLSVGSVDGPIALDDDDRRLLSALASAAALAVHNRRTARVVEDLATVDELTGLLNHRAFFERFESELARGRRYDTPVALALLDIDDFRSYNARYGRRAGDEILRSLARLLVAEVRRDLDVVCRYGGQEFAVILPNTPQSAIEAGERLRRRVESATLLNDDGVELSPVTVSVGVVVFPQAQGTADALADGAVQAVYTAKKAGRNRVEVVGAPRG